MPINELASRADAKARLRRYFGGGLPKEKAYLDLLGFLCEFDQAKVFETQLERVSAAIWTEYNTGIMPTVQNRFTRSIINLGAYQYGFSCQDNVVFTGPLSSAAFGARVRDKVLWKDSFALDHGEFSHSYQWLAAGRYKGWGSETAAIYSSVSGLMSQEPLFHIQNGALVLAQIPLWEWMVDCTLYKVGWDGQVEAAVDAYLNAQLAKWCTGALTNRFFVAGFITPLGKELTERRGEAGLEAHIRRTYSLQLNTFRSSLVARYPDACALTSHTYRSANNVTKLVRSQSGWFINLYERHRTGFRGIKNSDLLHGTVAALPRSKLEAAQANGQAALFAAADPQGTMTRAAKESAMRGKPFAQAVQRTSPGATAHQTNFPSAHPLEGIKRDRMEHYDTHRQAQGWTSADTFAYQKPYGIADLAPAGVAKPQQAISFHGEPGQVNTTLPVNAIQLLK